MGKIDMARLAETQRVQQPAFRTAEPLPNQPGVPSQLTARTAERPTDPQLREVREVVGERGAQRITLLMPRSLWRLLKAVAEEGPVDDRVPISETIRLLAQLWATDPALQARVADLHRSGDQIRRKGPEPRWG
jgi:hypothetical protein